MKVLLVEGQADRRFFEACLRVAGFSAVDVKVKPPLDYGAGGDGKGNALSLLPELVKQMEDGGITHLGVVVDSDHDTNHEGFAVTGARIVAILDSLGYAVPKALGPRIDGYKFTHRDGLPSLSCWIMPNNSSDGFVEDFVTQSVEATESDLLTYARQVVSKLPRVKFETWHTTKAEVAAFLAFQTSPGQQLAGAVGSNLLNFESGLGRRLVDWLKSAFA